MGVPSLFGSSKPEGKVWGEAGNTYVKLANAVVMAISSNRSKVHMSVMIVQLNYQVFTYPRHFRWGFYS